jgi:hypothetical protein
MQISNNELNDTINCLYRMKYVMDDFKHIEQYISKELKDLLEKEIQEATDLENNRLHNLVD